MGSAPQVGSPGLAESRVFPGPAHWEPWNADAERVLGQPECQSGEDLKSLGLAAVWSPGLLCETEPRPWAQLPIT